MLLYELFHKKAPFKGRNVSEVKKNLKQNKIVFKKDIDPEVKDWIIQMLNILPKKRPPVHKILKGSFFGGISQELKIQRNISKNLTSQPSLEAEEKQKSKQILILNSDEKEKRKMKVTKNGNLKPKTLKAHISTPKAGLFYSRPVKHISPNVFLSNKQNGLKIEKSDLPVQFKYKKISPQSKNVFNNLKNESLKLKHSNRVVSSNTSSHLFKKHYLGGAKQISLRNIKNFPKAPNQMLNQSHTTQGKPQIRTVRGPSPHGFQPLSKSAQNTESSLIQPKKTRKNLVRFKTFGEKAMLNKIEGKMTIKKEQLSPQSFKKKGRPEMGKEGIVRRQRKQASSPSHKETFVSSFQTQVTQPGRTNPSAQTTNLKPLLKLNKPLTAQNLNYKLGRKNQLQKRVKRVPAKQINISSSQKQQKPLKSVRSPPRNRSIHSPSNAVLSVTSPAAKSDIRQQVNINSNPTHKLTPFAKSEKPFSRIKQKFQNLTQQNNTLKTGYKPGKLRNKLHSKSVYSEKVLKVPNTFNFQKFMKSKVGSLRKNVPITETKTKHKNKSKSLICKQSPFENKPHFGIPAKRPMHIKTNLAGKPNQNKNNTSLFEKARINTRNAAQPVSPKPQTHYASHQKGSKSSGRIVSKSPNNIKTGGHHEANTKTIIRTSFASKGSDGNNESSPSGKQRRNNIIKHSSSKTGHFKSSVLPPNTVSFRQQSKTGHQISKNTQALFKSQDRRRVQITSSSKDKPRSEMSYHKASTQSYRHLNANGHSTRIQKLFKSKHKKSGLGVNRTRDYLALKSYPNKKSFNQFHSEQTSPLKPKPRSQSGILGLHSRMRNKLVSEQAPSQLDNACDTLRSNYLSHQPVRDNKPLIAWHKPSTPSNASKAKLRSFKINGTQKFQVLKPRKPVNSKLQFKSMSPSSYNMRRVVSQQSGYLSIAGKSSGDKKLHFFQPKIINKGLNGESGVKGGAKRGKGKMQKLTDFALANVHSKSHIQKQIRAYHF